MVTLKYHKHRDFKINQQEYLDNQLRDIRYIMRTRNLPYSKEDADFSIFKTALDLGCSNNALVNELKKRGVKAYGIDLRILTQGIIQADSRYLPFKDESFDLVTDFYMQCDMWELQGLSLWDLDKVNQEAYRVLRPNGYFVISPVFDSNVPKPFKKAILNEGDFGEITLRIFQK